MTDPVTAIGIGLTVMSLGILAIHRAYMRLGQRTARSMRTTKIADARIGPVTIRGMIATTGSTVEGLFAPDDAVFVRVILERASTEGWSEVRREDRCVPFLLDDGSGIASIDATNAKIASDRSEIVLSTPNTPNKTVLAWVRAHDLDPGADTLRVTVETFRRDDEVSVHGFAEPMPDGAPYRSVASTLRVVERGATWMFVTHEPIDVLAASGRLNAAD